MSFQAKRLRVQLPCGEATVIEERAQEAFCGPLTCLFHTDYCAIPSGWCWWPSRYQWFTDKLAMCGGGTRLPCPAGSEQPVDPGRILVDPEQLPALREALETQLKEIEKAEQALKERGGEGKG